MTKNALLVKIFCDKGFDNFKKKDGVQPSEKKQKKKTNLEFEQA